MSNYIDFGSLVLSAVAILITIWATVWGKHSDQTKQNVRLIEQYYSPEFFINVRSIIWEIDVKWFNLPEQKREAYQKEVVLGWAGYLDRPEQEILHHEVPKKRIDANHHLTEVKRDYLTEHQALSLYLSFWIKIYKYYETKEISKKALKTWKPIYEYDRKFIDEFRSRIIDLVEKKDLPEWIVVTQKLEKAFAHIK